MVKHLIEDLSQIQRRLQRVDLVALFLDYDGTLVPFAATPEGALPSPEVLRILGALAAHPRCRPVIISGRELSDLKEMLGDTEGLTLAGSHGLEIATSDDLFIPEFAKRTKPLVESIYRELERELAKERGIKLECKGHGLSLACHYRLVAPGRADSVVEKVESTVERHDRDRFLTLMPGKKVVEILPRGWHKGRAAEMILERWAFVNDLPIYIGDDITDERAIQFLVQREEGWITIRVMRSPTETAAHFYLRGPAEVQSFLKWLLQALYYFREGEA